MLARFKKQNNSELLNYLILFFIWIGFIQPNNVSAFSILSLKSDSTVYEIDSSYFRLWNPVTKSESPAKSFYITNEEINKDTWVTFTLSNPQNKYIDWYLLSYNYSISEIDLVEFDSSGNATKQIFRDSISIYERYIEHKQPVFSILLKPKETKKFYLRVKNNISYDYVFVLFSHEAFLSHFLRENLIYGIFYGFMLFVILYNIFHYLLLREKVILFYCFFIFFQLIHMLFRDGTGLFIIPNHTEYADILKNLARGGLAVFLLLYTYYYFRADSNKSYYKWFIVLIIIRIVCTVILLNDTTHITFHLELLTILFCTFFSYTYYKKDNGDAKYMVIGLSLLSIAYTLYYVSIILWSSMAGIGFFAMYYGIAGESIFMTLALTERFKRIKLDNFKKQQMNQELELLVDNRTTQIAEQNKLLEEKSDELNLFLYSASHDLRGPLKSIEGLCNVGLLDQEANHSELYHLIIRKLKNLESNISDLNSVTKLKNEELPKSIIDFNSLHEEIKERFDGMPGFQNLTFNYSNLLSKPYIADSFSVKCIYQNIFENALKYKDSSRDFILSISIFEESPDSFIIRFEDNGVGISDKILPNIFNMFYRGNEESREDTGLGLYIVKQAINKLGGEINVLSKVGQGTVFIIKLPFNK